MMNYFYKKIQQLAIFVSHSGFAFVLIGRMLIPSDVLTETSTPSTTAAISVVSSTLSALPEDRLFYPAVAVPDRKVAAILTAYSSTPDQTDSDPFTAASGKQVYDGMIAANWLPFGTKVKIPDLFGEKIFTVDDRMNARYGFGRIDIWMDGERKQLRAFGVRRTTVEIYYPSTNAKNPIATSALRKQIARQ